MRRCLRCFLVKSIHQFAYRGSGSSRKTVCTVCEPLFTDQELEDFQQWLHGLMT